MYFGGNPDVYLLFRIVFKSFHRTGDTPMHFHNEGRDITVLTLRKH